MKLHSTLILGCAVVLLTFVNPSELKDITTDKNDTSLEQNYEVDIGFLIDDNMSKIQRSLLKVDPAPLPDLLFKKYGGLTDGWIHNLSIIQRTRKCIITYINKILKLDLNMGWDDIAFDYNYNLKIWFISSNGTLNCKLNRLRLNVIFYVDFSKDELVLQDLQFTEVGEIHLELEGIFGGKWRSIIINLIMNLGERRLISRVQVLLFDTITHLLNEFNDNSWPHSKHKLKFVNMVGLRTINNNVP